MQMLTVILTFTHTFNTFTLKPKLTHTHIQTPTHSYSHYTHTHSLTPTHTNNHTHTLASVILPIFFYPSLFLTPLSLCHCLCLSIRLLACLFLHLCVMRTHRNHVQINVLIIYLSMDQPVSLLNSVYRTTYLSYLYND